MVTPNYTVSGMYILVVRITDDDGVDGWSYLWALTESQLFAMRAAVAYLAPVVRDSIGEPIPVATDRMFDEVNFFGFSGLSVFGISAFDMALHDRECRRKGVSLSHSLNASSAPIPAYWSGLMMNESEAGLEREVAEAIERGFRACKMRIGRNTVESDTRRLAAVRRTAGSDINVMVDAVQFYNPASAIEMSKVLADFDITWFEDPIRHDMVNELPALVAASSTPLATGENEYLPAGMQRVLDTGVPYILIELERAGGVTGWLNIAERASLQGAVNVTPHAYPHVNVQLCATLKQEERWIEYMPWFDQIVAYDLCLDSQGRFEVPDVVGTGFVPDLDAIDRCALGPWEVL